jgi:hypothetical protein
MEKNQVILKFSPIVSSVVRSWVLSKLGHSKMGRLKLTRHKFSSSKLGPSKFSQ